MTPSARVAIEEAAPDSTFAAAGAVVLLAGVLVDAVLLAGVLVDDAVLRGAEPVRGPGTRLALGRFVAADVGVDVGVEAGVEAGVEVGVEVDVSMVGAIPAALSATELSSGGRAVAVSATAGTAAGRRD